MDSEELLAQLADIHLPEAVSYWPPAPGWWVLALLLLLAAGFLILKVMRSLRQQKICRYALAELERCFNEYSQTTDTDTDELKLRYINQFNTVIRRVALVHFPQANVASLAGAAWVDFIQEKGNSSLMTEEMVAALKYGRFQTKCDVDVDAMQEFGQQWVNALYLGTQKANEEPQGLNQNA